MSDQKAKVMEETSIFTKYFIQCLMGKSPTTRCSKLCMNCAELSSGDGFITVEKVLRYVNKHYKDEYKVDIEPVQFTQNITEDDTKIAYFTDTEIVYQFKHCLDNKAATQDIPLCDIYNITMEELWKKLFEHYNGEYFYIALSILVLYVSINICNHFFVN